jgi:GAF domain-containing protein
MQLLTGAGLDWRASLDLIRAAAARFNRIGPETSLREALALICETAVRLMGPGASAVVYLYDDALGAFDPTSRVSAGEDERISHDDVPRPDGVGMVAIQTRARVLSYETGLPFHPIKLAAGIRTAACYPLWVGEQTVGALYLDLREARRFSEDELRLLDTLVASAAVAIYNTRQFESVNRALQRKLAELEKLQHAAQLISTRPNLSATLNEILDSARNLTGAEFGSFRLFDRQRGDLPLAASKPPVSEKPERVAKVDPEDSVMGWTAFHRRTAIINDLSAPPWTMIYKPLGTEEVMRSELAVPLLGPGGSLLGVLNVESPRAGAFSNDDAGTLEAFAAQASIAIQEARLLAVIEEITDQLARSSPNKLLALLIDRACELLNVPHSVVWEVDAAQPGTLMLRAANFDSFDDYRVPLRGSLLGATLLSRRPVYSPDMNTDPLVSRRKLSQQMKWVSALVVPLIGRDGQPRGAFGVYTRAPRTFSDWEQRLLSTLANHAAVALQQAEAVWQVKLAQERQAVAETFAVLGDVAANLIHRVNNMVGVIPALAQGLGDKRPDLRADPAAAKVLDDIERSARAAMTAARDSVAYLRPFTLEPISVRVAYQTALQRIGRPVHISITSVGLNRLPLVEAGEEQLRQVLVNLIENALEALGETPGRIITRGHTVADMLDPHKQWVELVISDTGPGVPEGVRERIFDATFSTKGAGRKLGFGLWWVKSWVQRFGGSIVLAEPSPSARHKQTGCTFVLRLPIAPGAAGAQEGRRETEDG